jgi:hypothetical protein
LEKLGAEACLSSAKLVVIRDASLSVGVAQFAAIVSVAPSLGVELTPVNDSDPGELERAVADFARAPNGDLVLTGGPQIVLHRDLIAALAARHRLPAVYSRRVMVDSGGLASYGPDVLEHDLCVATNRRLGTVSPYHLRLRAKVGLGRRRA